MELRHLRTFLAVAEELHFGRAAARLNMAQPPVSQQIQQLEKDLGVRLFERSTRSVSLTAAGQAFLDPARAVLDDVDLARRAAVYGTTGVTGKVSLGFSSISSRKALPLLLRAVRREQPGIELALRGRTFGGAMVGQILYGALDLGMARLPLRERSLDWHVFDYEALVAALPTDHPLAVREALTFEDLAEQTFITFPAVAGSPVREATMHIAAQHGFSPRVLHEAPDTFAILSLVAAGVGVTITVSSVEQISLPGVCFRPLTGRLPMLAAVFAWNGRSTNSALPAVVEIAKRLLPTPSPSPALLYD
ncbi:LysR substrate-binding domain-containing protein [Pseudonocardia halophobica]|uniref:LysR family transcriptional regulator n=1 Tax=Pseudonocardia halophobica TaxID=29401 RepID=A0A9W6L1V3_9PSEU|nr:LysR substrate-binding domain-containing protein [Pseudonocardia halophobica]GLL10641.1 LysR family transcriptional regulator [Pseudonocardia halophobica]